VSFQRYSFGKRKRKHTNGGGMEIGGKKKRRKEKVFTSKRETIVKLSE
jgi:hypothetical protein